MAQVFLCTGHQHHRRPLVWTLPMSLWSCQARPALGTPPRPLPCNGSVTPAKGTYRRGWSYRRMPRCGDGCGTSCQTGGQGDRGTGGQGTAYVCMRDSVNWEGIARNVLMGSQIEHMMRKSLQAQPQRYVSMVPRPLLQPLQQRQQTSSSSSYSSSSSTAGACVA